MAETRQQKQDEITKLEKEAANQFNQIIALFLLIGDSRRSKKKKLELIRATIKKGREWINDFVEKEMTRLYNRESKEAYDSLGEKRKELTQDQKVELTNLKSSLKNDMSGKIDDLGRRANRLVLIRELEQIRNRRLGYDGYVETRVVKQTTFKKDTVFMDSKGRRVTTNALMAVVVGDQMWNAVMSGRRSTWLDGGAKFGRHISVIDDRTTDICLELDGQLRDLQKDDLPPMHPNCRSDIVLVKDDLTEG